MTSDRDILSAIRSSLAASLAVIDAQIATPAPVVSPPPSGPVESPDGTEITDSSGSLLVKGVVWRLTASSGKGYQIVKNGAVDPVTANVTKLARWGDLVLQLAHTPRDLWFWTDGSVWQGGTASDPRVTPSTPATPSSGVPIASGAMPRGALDGNLKKQIFADEFDNLTATIDYQSTGDKAFLWSPEQPWGGGPDLSKITQPEPSVVRIATGDGNSNAAIMTYAIKHGHGACVLKPNSYVTARIRMASSDQGPGWPAFWLFSLGHMQGADPWNGQWGEIDAMELMGQGGGQGLGFTCHQWGAAGHAQNGNSWWGRPGGFDFTRWHEYGLLWQPGTITWYVDDKVAIAAPAFDILNHESMPIILGSGPNQPMDVDYVRAYA